MRILSEKSTVASYVGILSLFFQSFLPIFYSVLIYAELQYESLYDID